MEHQPPLRVVSKFSEFTGRFLLHLDPRVNGHPNIQILYNDTFEKWGKIEANLKEIFFMEVYVMCSNEMENPHEAWKVIGEELSPILKELEQDTRHMADVDAAGYSNLLYVRVRQRVREVAGKKSREIDMPVEKYHAKLGEEDPPGGRFYNWMQDPSTEACRDICELENGKQVIYWSYQKLLQQVNHSSLTQAEHKEMYMLECWHANDRDGDLRGPSTEEELRETILLEKWLENDQLQLIEGRQPSSPNPAQASRRQTSIAMSDLSITPEPQIIEPQNDNQPVQSMQPLRRTRNLQIIPALQGARSLQRVPRPQGSVTNKIKQIIQRAPNRRLTLKEVERDMKEHHVPTKTTTTVEKTLYSTIRSTMSRRPNFSIIIVEETNWWVAAEDLRWDKDIQSHMHLTNSGRWERCELRGRKKQPTTV